jgi:adenylate cyclase
MNDGKKVSFRYLFNFDTFFLLSAGVVISLLTVFLYIFQPELLQFIDYKIYDGYIQSTPSKKKSDIPVIIDIDEESLEALGQWPWPRYRLARLLDKISSSGAISTGIDILLSEPDRTSPERIQKQLKNDLGVNINFHNLPEHLQNNDQILADTLGRGTFTLGFYLNFENQKTDYPDKQKFIKPVSIAQLKTSASQPLEKLTLNASGAVSPIRELAQAAPYCGFYNSITDFDGVVRRIPLIMSLDGRQYPSLALSTLMKAYAKKNILVKTGAGGIDSIQLGATIIPVDPQALFMIRYHGPQKEFSYYSAKDVISGKIGPKELNGKIIFIGTSAAGLKDMRVTPFSADYPGVEVHATVVDNILTGNFILKPDWVPGLELCLIIISGILTTVLLTWTRSIWMFVPIAAIAVAILGGSLYAFTKYHIFLTPMYSFIVLALNFSLLTLIKFWREEGKRKFLRATFSSYLAPELINEMISKRTMPELGGEARLITAFFTDIQNFSEFSEKLTAVQLVELLNEYLSAMTDILIAEKGTLDKYEGDAIIAFFGAPIKISDHALRACRVALAMQKMNNDLRKKWSNEKIQPAAPSRNTKNIPDDQWIPGDKWPIAVHKMQTRIGINTGEIVVGNMGSSMRMNYTMMGDAVNTAARLEAGAKQYGIYTAVSDFTLEQECKDTQGRICKVIDFFEVRLIDCIQVVGKEEPVKIYELMSVKGKLTGDEKILLNLFNKARKHYAAMEWDKAVNMFHEALKYERFKDCKTNPSKVLLKRAEYYKSNPPVPAGETWDGIHRLTQK